MDKIQLGQTRIEISRLGLGTVKFGRNQGVKYPESFKLPTDEAILSLLGLAQSLGINTLDTAPAYGNSEERLGKLLGGNRKDWVIISKAGEEFSSGQSSYHFTPDHFKFSLERTLKRLNTDYLDILLIHCDDRDIEILSNDALIKTMHDFKAEGLVRAIGASTKTAEGGIMALKKLDTVMATYTPDYTDEMPVLDYAAKHNKGVILKKLLGSGHATNLQNAIEHAFAHKGVTGAIIGTINPHHLRDNVACLNAAVKQS